jgi:ABC-type transport system substrate-binding protein
MRTCGLGAVLVTISSALLLAASGTAYGVKEGGTFRVTGGPDWIDPAFGIDAVLTPACGTLMGYPDKPVPEGLRLGPELAKAKPVVSRDGRTYTFTIRKDARFSDGKPVTARAFARALERMRDPALKEDATDFGVRKFTATGRTLTLRLAKRDPLFLANTTELCAVPPNLPVDGEGVKAPLPSAAPYYAAQYVPGELLALERNRFYKGSRVHHVDRFVFDLAADPNAAVDDIASGKFDCCVFRASDIAARAAELAQRYGVNKPGGQFVIEPGAGLRMFVLNTSRPLFKNNPKLRQAINFAVDRRALTRELGPRIGSATDQYLLPVVPGFRDERIYPLKAPDLKTARRLARGNLRGAKAVLYAPNLPARVAGAEIIKENLSKIGLEVEIRPFPPPLHFQKMATPGERFDIADAGWFSLTAWDPSFLNWIFDGRTIANAPNFGNYSYFNSPKYNSLLDQASRLTGAERERAYGDLDLQLSRDAAPAIPFAAINSWDFVSARTGCVVMNPLFDLTAVCLK